MWQDRREKRCPRHAFEPLVGFFGVYGLGPDENGGALLSIAAPSMPCEANRPLTSHAERNQVKQWVCHTRRCAASVSFYGNNPPHGKLQEILVAEGERFGLSGGFEPPTVFRAAAINHSASPPVGCAERIRTPDLLLMGQASYQTAPPRNFSSVFCQRTTILSHM